MRKKTWMLLPLLALAGVAQAGTYSVLQQSDCPLVSAGELSKQIRKVSSANGLDLPKDMAIRAELHCAAEDKNARANARFVYTFRAAIEKQVADGEMQRWTPVAYLTGYGTTVGSGKMMREVGFTVRDLIRQEP